jgi:hypothetical protein
MAGRPAFKLVAPLAAFVFLLGAAAPGAMGHPCRTDVAEPAGSHLAGQMGSSGRGATCCCERAEASLPAPAIAQRDRTTLSGAGAAVTQAAQSPFWLASSVGPLNQRLTSLNPGSPIPILLITRSLLI